MITFAIAFLRFLFDPIGRRGGHCYYEQGSPLWSHASSRCPTVRSPIESHTRRRVGSREKSPPPDTWTESGLTPILQGSV